MLNKAIPLSVVNLYCRVLCGFQHAPELLAEEGGGGGGGETSGLSIGKLGKMS